MGPAGVTVIDTRGDKGPGRVPLWLLPAAVVFIAAAIALVMVDGQARTAVAWCGGLATLLVAAVSGVAESRGRVLAGLRAGQDEREAVWQRQLAQQEAEMVRLASLLPEAVTRLQRGEFAEDVLEDVTYEQTLSPEFRAAHETALRAVVEAIQRAEDLRESAQRGFVNIARRVQAIVHQQAQSLREMEERHGQQHAFFGDLLKLDHSTALVGRLADSIAVLGGDRPGRQWGKAVPLYSVLRGAMSRIIDYQRIELHPVSEVAVVGPAVEPLIHALAELLDNATRYSPPQAKVHLTAVEVQSGIAIEIEDGGVGLSEEARQRAERMLQDAQAGIDLHDLGESPRLGLAVVGRLAQAYELRVSLRSSAYGGVRAVLIVPQKLITTTPATSAAHGIGTVSGPRPLDTGPARRRPVARPSAQPASQPLPDEEIERASNGLPQRRRHRPKQADQAEGRPAPVSTASAAPTGDDPDKQPGLWLGEFTRALAGEQAGGVSLPQSRDEVSDDPDKGE